MQTEKTLKISELKAQQDVALWKRKFKYFQSVFKSRQSDIGKATESVRLAREGRRVGSRTNTDLLDAETDLFRAQAGAVKAQLGIIEALINLELSTGRKLYEFI
jgi:outer membrane protein TolC